MSVKENFIQINQNILDACHRAGRNPDAVKVIAVTKYVTTERAIEAVRSGINHLGENRQEGLKEKYDAVGDRATWHFIGSLQSKKVKHVVEEIDYLHSLDRMSLAKELDKRLQGKRKLSCFVQVNVSGEESKAGLSIDEVMPFIEELSNYPSIHVVGLMTMAPFVDDKEETRPVFQKLKHVQETIAARQFPHAPCTELSMGMSNDFEVAIEEGATFIRIGTALVGNELKNK